MGFYLGDFVKYGGRLAQVISSRPASYPGCKCCSSPHNIFDLRFTDNQVTAYGILYEEIELIEHPKNHEPSVLAAGWSSVEEYDAFLLNGKVTDLPTKPRSHNRVWLKEDCKLK